MQAQAWPRLWPAGCESHLHPWAEHKLVPRPSTCCSTRRSRWTAAAQQGYHQGLCAASRETDQLLLAPLVKAAYWHNFQKSCSLHRSCFWHRVHELLSAQVNPSGTGSGWLHRLGSGRRCMSMFCMLYRLEAWQAWGGLRQASPFTGGQALLPGQQCVSFPAAVLPGMCRMAIWPPGLCGIVCRSRACAVWSAGHWRGWRGVQCSQSYARAVRCAVLRGQHRCSGRQPAQAGSSTLRIAPQVGCIDRQAACWLALHPHRDPLDTAAGRWLSRLLQAAATTADIVPRQCHKSQDEKGVLPSFQPAMGLGLPPVVVYLRSG